MSGPVGSEYPGNFVMVLFAGLLAYLSGKSAVTAFRRRRGGVAKFDAKQYAGLAVFAFLMFAAAVWAIWIHVRTT